MFVYFDTVDMSEICLHEIYRPRMYHYIKERKKDHQTLLHKHALPYYTKNFQFFFYFFKT